MLTRITIIVVSIITKRGANVQCKQYIMDDMLKHILITVSVIISNTNACVLVPPLISVLRLLVKFVCCARLHLSYVHGRVEARCST